MISKIKQKVFKFFKKKIKKNINLGGNEKFNSDYSCLGLTSEFNYDITKNLSVENNSIEFIWSERVLEHIMCDDLYNVFLNIKKILKTKSKARFCLPSCFYNNDNSIDMMRSGNAEKQKKLGHVTFFTYEGYGPILDNHFGTSNPPNPKVYFKELFSELGFQFKLLRYHNKEKKVIFDKAFLSNENSNHFIDRQEIIINRTNSLIFDIIKN